MTTIADEYLRRFGTSAIKERWTRELIHRTAPGGNVLDLGCGAGVPLARRLIAERFAVTGVDGSGRQIELARQHVPEAVFVQADMTSINFEANKFDAVAAFYSLNHVPRALYTPLFGSIYAWLRPGGVFVGNFGGADEAGWTGEWLGAPTYFAGHDPSATLALIANAGFDLELQATELDEDGGGPFLWVVVSKTPS